MADLTEQEYVDSLGLACPVCKETDSVGTEGGVETDDGVAWQSIYCNRCDISWTDNYNLVGYSNLGE